MSFPGTYTALITPFRDGAIDIPAFQSLIERQIAGGVDGIVPCGVTEHGVTSLVDLGLPVAMAEADEALKSSFRSVFGDVMDADPPLQTG